MLRIKTTSISPPQKPTVLGYEFPSLHVIFFLLAAVGYRCLQSVLPAEEVIEQTQAQEKG